MWEVLQKMIDDWFLLVLCHSEQKADQLVAINSI